MVGSSAIPAATSAIAVQAAGSWSRSPVHSNVRTQAWWRSVTCTRSDPTGPESTGSSGSGSMTLLNTSGLVALVASTSWGGSIDGPTNTA